MRFRPLTLPPRLGRFLYGTALAGLGTAYLVGMAGLSALAHISHDLPDPARLWEQNRPPSIQIVDRNGHDLAVRGAHTIEPLPVAELPPHVRQAVLATEDRRFHQHAGLDPYGLLRAAIVNLQAGHVVQGGSTLTQQLTKNVFLAPDRTLTRKAQEMILAVWLERRFTKSEVLRLYLSRVYFGSGAWGLEAASDTYFGRPPDQLTLSEAALLAGLLKAPSALNPVHHSDAAALRMRAVLRSMDAKGLLDDGVLEAALAEPVHIRKPRRSDSPEHFIDWIWPELEERIGVPNRDLVVQVSLDADIQRAAQAAVAQHLDPARGATEAALVLLGDRGEVLAMVGGADYSVSQFNRAVQSRRQPGSAFKPIVYLAALRVGLHPWTQRLDAPIAIDGPTGTWRPRNFTDEYLGSLTLEDALAKSINTVAVRVSEEIGRERVVETAAELGLDGFEPFASLALGAQGARVLDMAGAYQPLSNGGDRHGAYGLISIATGDGQPLFWHEPPPPIPTLNAEEIRLMNRMLVGAVERGTGQAARVDGRMVAGKTGTTNDHRDAWFVGYAPGLTLAVWVGNDDDTPMDRVTGGQIPAQIFADVMGAALAERPVASLPQSVKSPEQLQAERMSALLDRLETANQIAASGSLPAGN